MTTHWQTFLFPHSKTNASTVSFPWLYRQCVETIERQVDRALWEHNGIHRKNIWAILMDGFNVAIENLTSEEIGDITVLFHFFLKRVIHGDMQFQGLSTNSINPILPSVHRSSIIWHDIAHCVARYMLDPENRAGDPSRFTPTPFKYAYDWCPEHYDALTEELYAFLWMRSWVWKRENLFVFDTLREYVCSSWEELYTAYIHRCLEEVAEFDIDYDSLKPFLDWYRIWFMGLLVYKKKKRTVDLLRIRMQQDTFPKLNELLTYVFEHQSEPRVLIDLSLREMQPLIDQLKKRKIYNNPLEV